MVVDLNNQEMQLIMKFREMDEFYREQAFRYVMNSRVKSQSAGDFLRSMDELREAMDPESLREINATLEEMMEDDRAYVEFMTARLQERAAKKRDGVSNVEFVETTANDAK